MKSYLSRLRPRAALWQPLGVLLVVYLLVVLVMALFEERLIFFPVRYPRGDWQPPHPAVEDAWFVSADGTRLHGWYLPHDDPRGVVLFAQGNAGNVTYRAERLRNLHERFQLSVLVFDYRGYGRSEGRPSEAGVLADARAARTWLARREGIEEAEIIVWGESLGGAVAVDLAAAEGARALVLENTFTCLPDVAAYHFPWLPVRRVMRCRLDSLERIARYHGPLLLIHGTADRTVPYELGQRLFAAAPGPKTAITVEGGPHYGPPFAEDNPQFCAALEKLLSELAEHPSAGPPGRSRLPGGTRS